MALVLHKCVWGPRYWAVLHTAALTFDNDGSLADKTTLKGALKTLALNVPCGECRPHAASYFQNSQHAADWESAQTSAALSKFFVDFHNAVNARLGTREFTVAQAEQRWKQVDSYGGATVLAVALVGGASLLLGIAIGRAGRQCELRCHTLSDALPQK